MRSKLLLPLLFVTFLLVTPKPTYALGLSDAFHLIRSVLSESTTSATLDTSDDHRKVPDTRKLAPRPFFENTKSGSKSGEIRTDACELRKAAAENRKSLAGDRVSKLLAYLDTVLGKVESFYTTKLLPAGKTVSTYDALVADIAIKKAAVQTAVTTVQSDATNISCTAGEIRTDFQKFHTDAAAVETAMKAYRDSIKSLLQAIRAVAGTPDAHSSSSPSASQH